MNRITNSLLSAQSISYLNNNLGILADIQEKLSSGKNINRPSDDPVGLTRILDLSNTLNVDNRYKRNIENAIAEVNTTDKALGHMVDLLHRAQELATQGANFTNNQQGRDAIALEIDEIINQMIQLGNSDIGGKHVFSGFKSGTPPFSRTGDSVSYAGTPPAEPWQRNVQIARGVQISLNINGQNLLGTSVAGTPTGGSGVFQTLVELKRNLKDAGGPTQLADIRARIDELAEDMNTVLAAQSVIGSISNRLELTQGRIEERKSVLTQQYAEIQDIDMPKTIADLNAQENIFQASLSVTARMMQTSLLDFLR